MAQDRKEYLKCYRKKNKAKIAETGKRYYENNKGKKNADSRRYRKENKDRLLAQGKKYYQNNKVRIAERNARIRELRAIRKEKLLSLSPYELLQEIKYKS